MKFMQEQALTRVRDLIGDTTPSVANGTYELTLEAFSSIIADYVQENSISTNLYPSEASTQEEIYNHLSDRDIENIFATPGRVDVHMYFNKLDILKFGKEESDGSIKFVLPKNTTIQIDGIFFNIGQAVHVKLVKVDTGSTRVSDWIPIMEATASTDFKHMGNINAWTIRDVNGVDWVTCKLPVSQYEISRSTYPLTLADKLDISIPYKDKFYKIELSLSRSGADDIYVKKTFKDVIFTSDITAKITLMEQAIRVEIPSKYMRAGYTGRLEVSLYTTKGAITVPLNDFDRPDFKIVLAKRVGELEAISSNIAMSADSNAILTGGSEPKSLTRLKKDIINRANGARELPITSHDIIENGRKDGIRVVPVLDTITQRLYSGTIPVPISLFSLEAVPSIRLGTASIIYADMDYDKIELIDDALIIKTGCLMKRTSKLTPITNNELSILNSLPKVDRINWYNDNDLGYVPYTYIVDPDHNNTNSRVYRLNKPSVLGLKVLAKNEQSRHRVNIEEVMINKIDNGYEIYILLTGHDNSDDTFRNNIEVSLFIDRQVIHMTMVGDPANGLFVTYLYSSEYVSPDGRLTVSPTQANDNYEFRLPLISTMDVYIHNTNLYTPNDTFIPSLQFNDVANINTLVVAKEELTIEFGEPIKWLWNSVVSSYTPNKYKKYQTDVPLFYQEDVYDPVTPFYIIDSEVHSNIIHKKGEQVIVNSTPQIAHRKDELILNHGTPEFDFAGGLARDMEIVVIDAAYQLKQSTAYSKAIEDIENLLHSWVTILFEDMNKYLLERTTIAYIPTSKLRDVPLTVNDRVVYVSSIISPTIKLNVSSDGFRSKYSKETLTTIIGNIIMTHLANTVLDKKELKESIVSSLGTDIVGITMKDFILDDLDVIVSEESFELKKKLTPTNQVVYDFEVIITKVY